MATEQLKTREACEYLNVCRKTLHRLWLRGRLKRTGDGKLVRWPKRELDRYLNKNTVGPRK